MLGKVDLSIVVLNFNTKELLRRCLRSIASSKSAGLAIETVVVDNASVDGSIEMVKKEFPWVKTIKNKKNLGFSAGNNIGIKQAKGEYLLLLNPDTLILPETLATMFLYMRRSPAIGVATCRVELRNGNIDDASHRGFPTPWNAFCHFSGLGRIFPQSQFLNGYHLGYRDLNRTHEIDACTGAFMMIKRRVGDLLGWLDEDYFWYGEDLDFCYRVKLAGYKVMYVPSVKIVHWKGASSGIRGETKSLSTASLETKRKAALASTAAMRIFYRKHYQKKYPRFVTFLTLLGISLIERLRLSRFN